MNADRRRRLSSVVERITELKSILSDTREEEEEARDSMPDNLQGSDRYHTMEEACDTIDEAEDLCDELAEKLQEIDGVTAE